MWQFGLALSALAIGSFATRDRCIVAVALALLMNWVINTGVVRLTGNDFPWGFFIGADYLTGLLIIIVMMALCDRARIAPIFVSASYIIQCVVHVAFGASGQDDYAKYYYWQTLFWIAVGQALFVFGWGVYELARGYFRTGRGMALEHGLSDRSENEGAD